MIPHRPSIHCFASCITAAGLAIGMQASPASALTTWNWSFATTDPNRYGSGTFTTEDITPTTDTTYTITDISGTYTEKGVSYTITGLNPGGNNVFRWDGTDTSPIISYNEGNINQIIFAATINNLESYIWLRTSSDGYNPIDFSTRPGPGNSFAITSSSLSPEGFNRDSDPVPGPLPLFGAAAAFHASRRLRRLRSSIQPEG